MAELLSIGTPASLVRLRRNWLQRLALELAALIAALLLAAGVGLVLLDTAPGHRFIVDQLAQLETQSGLRIRVGRIEGSLFGQARLRNVVVSDPSGPFLSSPEIIVDWAPAAWLYNALHIDRLEADRVTLARLPKLRPSARKGPILPDFDIHIGQLRISRLELQKGVSGTPRTGRVLGSAEIRAGRAMVDLAAVMDRGGDRLAARLDAEPDRDRFDVEVRLAAPADGVVPSIVGVKRPIRLVVGGNGTWSRWRGRAALDLSARPAARLALGVDEGRYRLQGQLAPAPFVSGRLRRLTAPVINVRGAATLEHRQLDGRLTLASPALRAVASGELDLARNRYDGVKLGVDLLRPPALFPNMRGRQVRLVWTLDGPFGRAAYAYRLKSPQVFFDQTGFVDVVAEGRGRLSRWPMQVPLRLSARAVTGIGDVAREILSNVQLQGMLAVTPKLVRGDRLVLTSNKLKARVSLLIDLVTGEFDILLSGGMTRYAIPGLGIVDVETDLRVVPGPGGKGSRVVGTAKALVRRLDNSLFRSLTEGLPRVEARLERMPDGILRFTDLQLFSPALRLSGAGLRRRDGTFSIEARGRQRSYGALRLQLNGRIERPQIDLLLDRPNEAMDLRDVRLLLGPTVAGYDYQASGGSALGSFTSRGQILIAPREPTRIAIQALDVGGTTAEGLLRSVEGGLSGRLSLAGNIAGELLLQPVGADQSIEAHLTGTNARFSAPTDIAVRRGRIDGTILLTKAGTTIDGTASGQGVTIGAVQLTRFAANAKLRDGSGQVRATVAGQRGSGFQFAALADVSPDRMRITGDGQLDRRPLALATSAVLTREGDGWRVAPTQIRYGSGQATVAGRTGSSPEISAQLAGMPLNLVDIFAPGLGLTGSANGRLDYRWGDGRPSGRADLRLRGVSRSGLVLSSTPVDVGIAAAVSGNRAGLRAVAATGGKVVGRAQARFSQLRGGSLMTALRASPLFAQLRYVGPADSLWRLTGVEIVDLSGPVALGADVGGTWNQPQIRGSVRSGNARLQSAVTGLVIDGLAASGRFDGSRLHLSSITGRTAGGGSIAGSGTIDLSAGEPALNLVLATKGARLLDRDDIQADVSGPVTIRSDREGGTIGGQLHLDRGRFQLGRASSGAAVPRLRVRETSRFDDPQVIESADLRPWRLALQVNGSNLDVRGLGINSRWRANLDVGGTASEPRLQGRAELVRGEYEFAGRSFRLERGIVRFNGESQVNPTLDIRADAQVQGVDASVRVSGTGLKPEITFASVPALPQDELLSRLLFGTSITNLSAPEALQLASAIGSLQSGEGGLDPINAVRRAAGLDRLRILPADIARGQKTAISAGKYVGRKLFVEVVTDGQGYSATQVEYQMTRWLSLLSSVSTIGRTSANVRISKDY